MLKIILAFGGAGLITAEIIVITILGMMLLSILLGFVGVLAMIISWLIKKVRND